MMKLAQYFTTFLIRHGAAQESDRDVYEYGLDIALYTMFSTLGLLLIGLFFGAFWEGMLLVLVFYLCQSFGGGYHAQSHMSCFVTMAIGLAGGLLLLQTPLPLYVYLLGATLGLAQLLLSPLILHENKSYLAADSARLTMRSRLISCCLAAALLVCWWLVPAFVPAFCVAIFLAAVSRLYAVVKKRAS